MYLIGKYKNLSIDEMSYVATLTHDLKSPAHAQINMLNLLLNGRFGQLNSQQYEMLKLTCSSAKYMSELVGTIMSDYKCKLNPIILNKTNFDIVYVLNNVLKRYEYLISERKLHIVINSKCRIDVYADELQIERVITNLISNAITYAFENSKIIIRLSQSGNCLNFSVSNKCHYINKNDLRNIFNKYSKTINSKFNKTSTGLGLYTAKRIISVHGGQIYARSTTDGVCTFGFKLNNRCSPANKIMKLHIDS